MIITEGHNEEFFIRDNDSSNGSYLNNKKLNTKIDYLLKPGDIITAGKQSFSFCEEKPQQHKGQCKNCKTKFNTYLEKSSLECPVCGEVIEIKI